MRSIKTYGGIGGVFVRKKRLSIDTRRSITPSPTTESILIGWDDVKCRPIFEKRNNGTPSTEISESDDELLNDDNDTAEDELSDDAQEQETTQEWNRNTTAAAGRKRLKSYGSRKKEVFFPEPTTLAVVSKKRSAAVKKNKRVPESNLVYPFASPQPMDTSICDALNSTQKSDPSSSELLVEGSNIAVAIETTNTDGMILKKRRRVMLIKKELLGKFDFVDEASSKQQPNSTTSISAAKAFFDRLDETELHVASSTNQTPQASRHRSGRSIKGIDLHSTDLQREYEAYSSASQESGVPPIALAEYAKNRSGIFRPNEMFDGFLDG
mmetsp:Transcript_5932/g.9881  ORF Transcript_5932/g.9881 Transcript_5932/m.9881 type:complete len:325 (+) Transcript_5932:293-1267(+)